jgi:hypothetical protein
MAPNTEMVRSNEWSSTPLQVARISLLELQPVETRLRRSFVSGVHETAGYVDSNNFSAQLGQRNRGSAISAAQVQHPHRGLDPGLDPSD